MTPKLNAGVSLTVSNAVATILFDRKHARNAMLFDTWCKLREFIEKADNDPQVRVLVLRGAGGHFGAGNDISEFGHLRGDAAGARAYGWAMADAMRAVETSAKPVIVAIEGVCFGASVALALAADIRFAAENTTYAITPAKLGALYLRSDHHRLVAAIGPGRARRMIFSAETLNAARANEIGLIDLVVSQDHFDATLKALTDRILRGSAYTLHHAKRILRSVGTGETPAETDESIGWFVEAMLGEDFAEGVAAFLSKRPPRFSSAT